MTDSDHETLIRLKLRVEHLEENVQELEADRKSAIRWALVALGGAVLAMGGYIWNVR